MPRTNRRVHQRPRSARSGSLLIEAAVVAGVLLIGSLGFVSLFTASSELDRSNRESVVAVRAAARVLEQLEGFEPHDEVIASHNTSADDDLVGLAPIPGFTLDGFEVEGLVAPPGDADGLPGEVVFPINPYTGLPFAGVDSADRQAVQPLALRLGAAGAFGSGLELVPVIVRVRWDSGGRTRTHQVVSLLAPR